MSENLKPSELTGDPVYLAAEQFRLAQELCGACRDYHALQPYRRLSGMVNGIEKDAEILIPILKELLPPHGRILIAGSADASLIALTWSATREKQPAITVVDRCPTPLAICERYAKAHGFAVETAPANFGEEDFPGGFDIVFGHGVLRFVAEASRVPFLKALGRALRKTGALVLVERPSLPAGNDAPAGNYSAALVAALDGAGIRLPESVEAFRARIDGLGSARRNRSSAELGTKPLRSYLEEAGFAVRQRHEHARRRTIRARDGGAPANFVTEIVVAAPAGSDTA
jgi:hypothetical protein